MKRKKFIVGGILAAGLIMGVVWAAASAQSGDDKMKPVELTDIDQLKTAFNKDSGVTRLILLLSPT